MFLDESAFDLDDDDKGFSRRSNATESRFSGTGPGMNVHDVENNDDDNDGGRMPSFGSAGGIGTPSSSRARMLAQQRDIQLKKRLTAIQSGGMIRSSVENPASSASSTENSSPAKPVGDSQFAPAVRHFSAPKAFRDETANDLGSEFRLPAARKPIMQVPQVAHNYQSQTSSNRKSSRFSDDEEEEEEEMSRNTKSAPQKGNSSSTLNNTTGSRRPPPDKNDSRSRLMENNRNNDYDDDDDDGYDYRKSRSNSSNRNQRPGRGRNNHDEEEEEEESYNEDKGRQNRGVSNNGRSSSHNRDNEYDEDRREPRGNTGGKWEVANGSTSKASDREKEHDRDRDRDRGKEQTSRRDQPSSEVARQGSQVAARAPLNLSNMKQFLTSPLPRKAGVVQCYIRRNKSGTNKLFPVYSLYLKDADCFLMASKKRPNNKTSNYLISMAEGDLSRDGANYLGKLRSNFVGTEFQIFDNGSNPKESEADEPLSAFTGHVRKDLGAVMYAANVLGSRGPRKMQVAIPSVDELSGGTSKSSSGDDILSRMRDRSLRDLAYLINKPPRWNEQVGAYVLNFNGRVTMASVKNFQLVDPEEQNSVVLQFGRVAKDEFTMDMQWPITPFQAFAVTLSSFDSKIACD